MAPLSVNNDNNYYGYNKRCTVWPASLKFVTCSNCANKWLWIASVELKLRTLWSHPEHVYYIWSPCIVWNIIWNLVGLICLVLNFTHIFQVICMARWEFVWGTTENTAKQIMAFKAGVNSSRRLNDAYIRQWTWSLMVQVMASHLFGTMPLTKVITSTPIMWDSEIGTGYDDGFAPKYRSMLITPIHLIIYTSRGHE